MLFNKNSVTQETGNKEVQITQSVSLKPVTPLINGSILPMEKDWHPEYISPSHSTEMQQDDSVREKKEPLPTLQQQKYFQPDEGNQGGLTWSQFDSNVSPKSEVEQGIERLVWNNPELGSFYLTKRSRRNLSHLHLYPMVQNEG